jgi:hypothetical protein
MCKKVCVAEFIFKPDETLGLIFKPDETSGLGLVMEVLTVDTNRDRK